MKPFIKVIVERREDDKECKYEIESVWSQETEKLCNWIWEVVDHFFSTKLGEGTKVEVTET